MNTNKSIIKVGLVAIIVGLIIYTYVAYFSEAYAGYSGGGMSGLPSAFAIVIALVLMLVGLLILVIALLWRFRQKRKSKRN